MITTSGHLTLASLAGTMSDLLLSFLCKKKIWTRFRQTKNIDIYILYIPSHKKHEFAAAVGCSKNLSGFKAPCESFARTAIILQEKYIINGDTVRKITLISVE